MRHARWIPRRLLSNARRAKRAFERFRLASRRCMVSVSGRACGPRGHRGRDRSVSSRVVLPDGAGSVHRADVQDLCGESRSSLDNCAGSRDLLPVCHHRGRRSGFRFDDGQAEGLRHRHDSRRGDRASRGQGNAGQEAARQDSHHQRGDEEGCRCSKGREGSPSRSIRAALQPPRWGARWRWTRRSSPRSEPRASWSFRRPWRIGRWVRLWPGRGQSPDFPFDRRTEFVSLPEA